MTDYLKNSELLETQLRKTLETDFSKLSKSELILFKSETYTYYQGANSQDNYAKLITIESRINDRLSSITAKSRFVLQVSLSILILIVALSSLALNWYRTTVTVTPQEQHKILEQKK